MMRVTSMPESSGQHQVEEDEVRALPPELRQGISSIHGRDDAESVAFECVDQGLTQGRLVFDDEHVCAIHLEHSDAC